VLQRTTRTSAPCRQFVELPNLIVQLAKLSETARPGVWRYEALVTNTGKGAATSVSVRFTVDGDLLDTLTVASVAPGETRSLVIRGPACRRVATLDVDPEKAIAETTDEDNLFELSCADLTNAG
jgi:subtilase family serine protease